MNESGYKYLIQNGWVHNQDEVWTHPDHPNYVYSFWAALSTEINAMERALEKPGTEESGGEFQGKDGEWRRM